MIVIVYDHSKVIVDRNFLQSIATMIVEVIVIFYDHSKVIVDRKGVTITRYSDRKSDLDRFMITTMITTSRN